MKPRGKINTPAKAKAAREYLGLNMPAMARVARLDSRETIRRIEEGISTRGVPGPYQLVLEALLSGWRPYATRLPIDDQPVERMSDEERLKLEREAVRLMRGYEFVEIYRPGPGDCIIAMRKKVKKEQTP